MQTVKDLCNAPWFCCYTHCVGYFAHQRRVVVAPVQTHTAILPWSRFRLVSLRLVVHDAEICLPSMARSLHVQASTTGGRRNRSNREETVRGAEETKDHEKVKIVVNMFWPQTAWWSGHKLVGSKNMRK